MDTTEQKQIRIALDAMGGDYAPDAMVKGAAQAVKDMDIHMFLVGQEDKIRPLLEKENYTKEKLEIAPASEIIEMCEHPTTAIRQKKDSSMVVGMKMVKDGKADAFVSAGSTGALLVGGLTIVGRIRGVERPVLATPLPTLEGFSLLVDSGANVDCKPQYLYQFAQMGSIYAKNVLDLEKPRVGLINIGAEKEKGNMLTKESYALLEESSMNFVGNVEARNIPYGEADVLVCDGFIGNTVLKLYEGVSKTLMKAMKEELTKGLYVLPTLALAKPFSRLKHRFDADEIGGAPFIGLKQLVVKAHGSSKEKAIYHAIRQCKTFMEHDVTAQIAAAVQAEKTEEKAAE